MRALSAVKDGTTYRLGHEYHGGMPMFGARKWVLRIPSSPTGGPFGANKIIWHDEFLATEIGQAGTQFDGLGHIGVQIGADGDKDGAVVRIKGFMYPLQAGETHTYFLLKHAHHPIRMLAVQEHGIASETVRTEERFSGPEPRPAGRARADHRLHRPFPQAPARSRAAVVADIVVGRSDDSESAVRIPEGEGDHPRRHRMAGDVPEIGETDVAGGDIGVKYGGEDELQPAALGPHHEVDTACVASQAVFQLALEEEHHDHRRNSEREQHDGQDRRQRPAADGAGAELERVHGRRRAAGASSERRRSNRPRSRESCVATTRVAPCLTASVSMSAATRSQLSSSRLDAGSSARITAGRLTTARASATRCA